VSLVSLNGIRCRIAHHSATSCPAGAPADRDRASSGVYFTALSTRFTRLGETVSIRASQETSRRFVSHDQCFVHGFLFKHRHNFVSRSMDINRRELRTALPVSRLDSSSRSSTDDSAARRACKHFEESSVRLRLSGRFVEKRFEIALDHVNGVRSS